MANSAGFSRTRGKAGSRQFTFFFFFCSNKKMLTFSYFSMKTFCGYSLEVSLQSISNLYPCFCGEIRKKYSHGYPLTWGYDKTIMK